mgnify:CR=1 FL=1
MLILFLTIQSRLNEFYFPFLLSTDFVFDTEGTTSSTLAKAGAAVGVVPLILRKLFEGEQHGEPSILKVPPVAVVETHTEYLVRVLIPQAVTWAQLLLVKGY